MHEVIVYNIIIVYFIHLHNSILGSDSKSASVHQLYYVLTAYLYHVTPIIDLIINCKFIILLANYSMAT